MMLKKYQSLLIFGIVFCLVLAGGLTQLRAFTTYPTSAACNALPGVMGDLNRDGLVNSYDYNVVIKMATGLDTYNPCGDLNNDTTISGSDISAINVLINDLTNGIYSTPLPEIDDYSFYNSGAYQCQDVLGDVNRDGKANYQDYDIILQMVMGQLIFSSCADLDHDGIVGPSDLTMINEIQNGRTAPFISLDPPAIYLNGAATLNFEVGAPYDYADLGAYAVDNQDVPYTNPIVINDLVDENVVGIYNVTYNTTDNDSNPAVEVVRKVIIEDTAAPVITLLGSNPYRLKLNQIYTDPGATATDNYDNSATITANIVIDDSAVDNTTVGSYPVTYNVIDANGNPAVQVIRTVEVYRSSSSGGVSPTNNTVKINDDQATTDDLNVSLTLNSNNASKMLIANNSNFSGVVWQDYDNKINWELESGLGLKTVYVIFESSTGNRSITIKDEIELVAAQQQDQNQDQDSQDNQDQDSADQDQPDQQVLGEKIVDLRQLQLNQIYDDAYYAWEGDVNKLLNYMQAERNLVAEQNNFKKYVTILTSNINIDLANYSQSNYNALTNFITYGTKTTLRLGEGERTGVLNSYKSAFDKLPKTEEEWRDVIKIANGRWPSQESKAALENAERLFLKVYLRDSNMDNPNDNAAVTIIAYGLRPDNRNFESEAAAVKIFTDIFHYSPITAIDWDVVRAIAYSGAIR